MYVHILYRNALPVSALQSMLMFAESLQIVNTEQRKAEAIFKKAEDREKAGGDFFENGWQATFENSH